MQTRQRAELVSRLRRIADEDKAQDPVPVSGWPWLEANGECVFERTKRCRIPAPIVARDDSDNPRHGVVVPRAPHLAGRLAGSETPVESSVARPNTRAYDKRVDRAARRVVKSPISVALAQLSPRENEVLDMTATGLTNAEIAAQLHLTVHSIKFHLASIYRKLGVANRTEAAVAYLQAATDQAPTNANQVV